MISKKSIFIISLFIISLSYAAHSYGSRSLGVTSSSVFSLIDGTLLDATPDHIQSPRVSMNDQGTVLAAYIKTDWRWEISWALFTILFKNGVWENPIEVVGSNIVSGHQITMNESGRAGLVYGVAFVPELGVAYFDGSRWIYHVRLQSDVDWDGLRYSPIGMDSNGILYVAYQTKNPDYSCDLVVARLDETGLLDQTVFPTVCGSAMLLSINDNDEVMVLLSNIGSRIFDGTSWGDLAPLSDVGPGHAFLKFYDSGEADFVAIGNQCYHYHYDGSSWGTGQLFIDGGGDDSSVAASQNGTLMIASLAWDDIKARFYDGKSWGPPSIIDDDDRVVFNLRTLVDGVGNFVVIWDCIFANYFDGAWHEQVRLDAVGGVLEPAITMNDMGDFTIIKCKGLNDRLYGMRYSFRPPVILIAPNGGEVIASGSIYDIQWEAPPAAERFTLKYSMNNGNKWEPIEDGITDTSYGWTVPVPKKNKTKCLVEVIGYDGSDAKVGADKSDAPFTIAVVKVISPNGGETLTSGTPYIIEWDTHGTKRPVAKVVLKYTKNAGRTWRKIKPAPAPGNPGSYEWTVPDVPKTKTKCKVKVVLKDAKGNRVGSDTSDGYFTIQP